MLATQLTCFACGKTYDLHRLIGLCECGKPLRVDGMPTISDRRQWSFRDLIPTVPDAPYRTLGEGDTPLLGHPTIPGLWIKDEAANPTGSFKARGMAAAVYMAHRFGVQKVAVPSAGNAGGALAAYAALYGIEAHVFMPRDVPVANRLECDLYGAKVSLVDGLITDCAQRVMAGRELQGWFDVSTLKEPYRIEGKKTMGYEIVRDLGWRYPDVILYPTGGGTGLIGMWKAFEEMERLGWVSGPRPRMISVQAEGCAPIVRAWQERHSGVAVPEPREPHTVAAGLRVPRALGDFIILDILDRSGGTAVAVSDQRLLAAARNLSSETGICVCPEGGACYAAYKELLQKDQIGTSTSAVLFNTGTGLKYVEAFGGD